MTLNKIIAIFSSKKSRIRQFIHKSPNMAIEVEADVYFITFSNTVTKNEVLALVHEFWHYKFDIYFHDSIHPTISDPGAYFSYSTIKTIENDYYSMTYGNHGWSGGIYHIKIETVSQQIYNLVSKGALNKIQITDVSFFSHYKIKEKQESDKKNDEIYLMHTPSSSKK